MLYANVADPAALFERFREPMIRDYVVHQVPEAEAEIRALRHIKDIILKNGALPAAWQAIHEVPDGELDEGDDEGALDNLPPAGDDLVEPQPDVNLLNAEQR